MGHRLGVVLVHLRLAVGLDLDDAVDGGAAALAAGAGAARATDLGYRKRTIADGTPYASVGDSVAVADEHLRRGPLGSLATPGV